MSRSDAIGIFWQDVPRAKGGTASRVMPPIPDTGWTAPSELPNLSRAKAISIDVETYDPDLTTRGPGWARGVGHICGLAVGTDDGGRWYFPIRHTIEKDQNMDPEHVLAWARDTLSDPRQPKIGANITYDVGWLRQEGVHVAGQLYDIQFAEALLDERSNVGLDDLAHKYLQQGKTTSQLYEWCSLYYGGSASDQQRKNIYRSPPRLVGPYAQGDVDLPFYILEKQWPLLAREGLLSLFYMECDLIPLVIEMRFQGVSIDLDRVEQLRSKLTTEIEEYEDRLRGIVGFDVNVDAADSIASAFNQLGIPYGFTKTGRPSFTKSFLETVDHPAAELIRRIRAHRKLRGTFVDGYLLDSHIDGKVYGSFHQLRGDKEGARSGRFSSSNPNLQNIPVRSALGKEIRKCFIPDPGHERWRKNDYSQIEYRVLAHYAVGPKSDEVRDLYNRDPKTDFHRMVQQLIYSITGLLGEDSDRPLVKNVNFGTVYGMGEQGLARYLNLHPKEAKRLFAAIHEGAPFLKETMEATMEEADNKGYITTILGRRSRFDMWEGSDWYETGGKPLPYEKAILVYPNPRRAYLHRALNRRLQGSAADLIKQAMLKCWKDGVFDVIGVPRLTVHDELDFSDPGGVDEGFEEMKRIMETAIRFRVPVRVSEDIGPNWGEADS